MSGGTRLSWQAVRARVHGWILDGTYGPGDRLPRDADMADALGCARSTVQRAMGALAEEGIVERRRKGGTHVRREPPTRAVLDIPVTRQEVEAAGAAYGYRLVAREVAETPGPVAARLGLRRPERMLRVRALHLADGRPHLHEDRWVSLATVPEIAEVDLSAESANEWLVRNRPYSRCDLALSARAAGTEEARLLATEPGAALFVTERTTWIGAAPITTVEAIAAPGYRLQARARTSGA